MVAEHAARGDVDHGLEQRLEAVVLDGVGQGALELVVVEQPLALGGLHGGRDAVLQRLLEGEVGAALQHGDRDERVHAVEHAGREVVQEHRLQALVDAPADGHKVVAGDLFGAPRRREHHDEGVVGEREVGQHVELAQRGADHLLQDARAGVEHVRGDLPAEDPLETPVALEADVEDGDLAALFELEADAVGDQAQRGQGEGVVAHQVAQVGARLQDDALRGALLGAAFGRGLLAVVGRALVVVALHGLPRRRT